jgi:hypothetical protein
MSLRARPRGERSSAGLAYRSGSQSEEWDRDLQNLCGESPSARPITGYDLGQPSIEVHWFTSAIAAYHRARPSNGDHVLLDGEGVHGPD